MSVLVYLSTATSYTSWPDEGIHQHTSPHLNNNDNFSLMNHKYKTRVRNEEIDIAFDEEDIEYYDDLEDENASFLSFHERYHLE